MAIVQRTMLTAILGLTDSELLKYWDPPAANNTTQRAYCQSQKIKSTGYQSFSIAGLAINFTISGILLLLGLSAIQVVPLFPSKTSNYRRRWTADGSCNSSG